MPDQTFAVKNHLYELRRRVLYCVAWFVVVFIACYIFSEPIVSVLFLPVKQAMPPDSTMVFTALTEGFMAYLKVAFWSALLITLPVFLYHAWRFLSPALYPNERPLAARILFGGTFLFLGGAIFGYFMVMPIVLSFTLGFASENLEALPRLQNYLLFTLKSMFTFGIIFEIPFLMAGATRMGLVHRDYFRKSRKFAYIALYFLAVFLVPMDIFSQLLLLIPLIIVYEIGVLLGGRGKAGEKTE